MDKEPEVPANYFGKGDDYILPDTISVVQEFERRWKEYEVEHPDDPTGELALAKFRAQPKVDRVETIVVHIPPPEPIIEPVEVTPLPEEPPIDKIVLPKNFQWKEIELVMPEQYVERFKSFAAAKRRRPRDILMSFIDKYCPKL